MSVFFRFVPPVLVIIFLALPSIVLTPSLSQSQPIKEAVLAEQIKDFERYKQQQQQSFQSYLEAQWTAFKLFKGEVEDSTPKPKVLPKAKPQPVPLAKPKQPALPKIPVTPQVTKVPPPPQPDKPSPPPVTKHRPQIVAPPVKPAPPVVRPRPDLTLSEPVLLVADPAAAKGFEVKQTFFGQPIQWNLPSAWRKWSGKSFRVNKIDKKTITDFWREFDRLPLSGLLKQVNHVSTQLGLNDYGEMLLIYNLAQSLNLDKVTSMMTLWGIFLKADKDVRFGYAGKDVSVLYHSQEKLFDTSYMNLDERRYYVFAPEVKLNGRIYTYKGDFSPNPEALDVTVKRLPKLLADKTLRTVSFKWGKRQYRFKVLVQQPLVGYADKLPQQGIATYFAVKPNQDLENIFIPQLQAAVENMTKVEAANFILRLVQKGFKYETDKQQFQHEKYMLVEQTLYYPASDCEDRSVLFVWLVKEVLGVEAIGLDYPGHIATAVHLGNYSKGKQFRYRGRVWTVADPTYINANIGMVMPKYAKVRPKFIHVN